MSISYVNEEGDVWVPLHNHEDWMDRGIHECECGESEAWHFVVYEP